MTPDLGTREFIASLVGSLAWPAAVVVALGMFRSTLVDLLSGQLQRLRAGPVELEWQERVAVVRAEIGQASRPLAGVGEGQRQDLLTELFPIAERSPTEAVIEGHVRLEEALKARIAGTQNGEAPEGRSAVGLVRRAKELDIVTEETVRAVEGVQVLRNLAFHSSNEVTLERAMEYLTLVQAVLYTLDARSTPDNPDEA